jgi:phospholipase C
MSRPLLAVLCVTLLLALTSSTTSPIKNIIVLMMENRSFDHFLGHLSKQDPRIDGLNGTQANPLDPLNPASPTMAVNYNAEDGESDWVV